MNIGDLHVDILNIIGLSMNILIFIKFEYHKFESLHQGIY